MIKCHMGVLPVLYKCVILHVGAPLHTAGALLLLLALKHPEPAAVSNVPLFLFLFFTGNMLSRGWSFNTPGSITGMKGSCIIIPCSFTYSTDRPTGLRVIWYLYQSNGYPVVFDASQSAVGEFRDQTSLIGSVDGGNCSLKMQRLEMSHNKDRLYPWVDKNPITSYHTVGHTFYDKTTQLIVSGEYWDTFLLSFT